MLNVEEVGVVLGFLDLVPLTGRNQAKNLSIVCAKLEVYRDMLVEAELTAKFAPKPANDSVEEQINKDLYPEGKDKK